MPIILLVEVGISLSVTAAINVVKTGVKEDIGDMIDNCDLLIAKKEQINAIVSKIADAPVYK